jgi:hypothetical protein
MLLMTLMVVTKNVTPEMSGKVTDRNRSHAPAPSSLAAS